MSTLIRVATRANSSIPVTLIPSAQFLGQPLPPGISLDPLLNVTTASESQNRELQTDQQLASASASDRIVTPDKKYKQIAFGLIIGGCGVGMAANVLVNPGPFAFEPGIGVFALFYVLAQAIERVLELLQFAAPGAGSTKTTSGQKTSKDEAHKSLSHCLTAAINHSTQRNLTVAADAKAVVEIVQMNRALLAWSFGSFLAMVGCGALGLYLIDAITTSGAPPRWIDLTITGLVIGAGTKPLHDLIKNLEAAKQNQENPAAAQA